MNKSVSRRLQNWLACFKASWDIEHVHRQSAQDHDASRAYDAIWNLIESSEKKEPGSFIPDLEVETTRELKDPLGPTMTDEEDEILLALTMAKKSLSYAWNETKRLGDIPIACQQVQAVLDNYAHLKRGLASKEKENVDRKIILDKNR